MVVFGTEWVEVAVDVWRDSAVEGRYPSSAYFGVLAWALACLTLAAFRMQAMVLVHEDHTESHGGAAQAVA